MSFGNANIRLARCLVWGVVAATVTDCSRKPSSTLSTTVDGKAVSLKTALAFSRGGRAIDLEMSSAALTCREVKADARSFSHSEVFFSATVAPVLSKDGSETWAVSFASYNANSASGNLGKVRVLGEPDATGPVALGLAFEIDAKALAFLKLPASKLVVKGDVVAEGCGVKENDAPVRLQKELTFSVAGKRFLVRGATVSPTDFPKPGHELTLATQAFDCSGPKSGTDAELHLSIGDDGKIEAAALRGVVFSTQLSLSAQAGGFDTLTAKPNGSLSGDGEVEIRVAGQLDMAGFAVEIDGSLSATRCPTSI